MTRRRRLSSVFVAIAFIAFAFAGVASAATTKITFRPPNYGGMSGYFSPSSSGPNDTDVLVVGGYGNGEELRADYRFNLSGFPQVVSKATMVWDIFEYFGPSGGWAQLAVCPNQEQWQSSTIDWSNQPYAPTCAVISPAPNKAGGYSIDLTADYNQVRLGSTSEGHHLNFGYTLRPYPNFPTSEVLTAAYSNNNDPPEAPDYRVGPFLVVEYNAALAANDPKLIKWPLDSAFGSRVILAPWTGNSLVACPEGGFAENNGVNYAAAVGTNVFASEDGFVMEITPAVAGGHCVVIQHNRPAKLAGLATSLYCHIDPFVAKGDFVPKGYTIGTVSDTQLHFGIRLGPYTAGISGLEGLRRANTLCGTLPLWQQQFINPENMTVVKFHQ
ncbi:MAG: hypothetical protein A3A33_05175 [Candidatus Yanofskybacteria bacterium RIFCSPLOWO2_01_FULL_49_25]|uniref:M23ase beta-sheet core domain-containing protein n=1 Tax=Candidatus Yanofskybacteria bacterium RIFCSPLOWO2_01_FULL_49_25 TaxID=1802701 RepID=A0A1F8GSW6_9BACT|nr:MAG: hypothetical protein A3A33_05175 [Candidatus Yanofskybacteria bacterium RIFCSPLOWO2_01_FULL_49_25]